MKLLFRRKADGRILKPIQTLDSYVRLQNAAGNRVWWAKKDKLQEDCDILTHDIERGDVLRDIRDGSMWIVEYVGLHGLRMQNRKDGVAGMTYFGLINYERVGRKYSLRDRQPHERASAIADAVNRVTHDVAQKTRVDFTRYDSHQVQAKMGRAVHQIVNRFDAVTNAQRHAQEYGFGFIRVERDGSMKAIDPRSVILR
ncbi:hypothetical protein EK99P-1_0054 [Escherichia phage EK99P-1]|uniref:Uncharacterized protein n=1 Tax=Escherichia phage EK99P-1 TaxID=1527514 RepID=A0A076YJB6_9CAUD|nr:hypothetical protein LD29_gp54 [Escherichia phage EK99P-1]AIK68766.1 hypothetical protein EK99P-1_0054 [Escherichia phage EK99P-1]